MGEQFDRASSLREIVRGIRECRRGEGHKDGPVEYYITALGAGAKLRREIRSGRYHARRGTIVYIFRPKKRVATAPWFRDRVWQRAMCNNGVYDDLTRGFLYENICCQKGKGQDLAIRIVVKFLQTLYWSDPGAPIYVAHLDIQKYFPSTPQKLVHELDRERITEPMFIPYLDEIIDMQDDPRSAEEIAADPYGKRGTGLGSQINQLNQIALLDKLDHEIHAFADFYIRYNDDFLILDHDRAIIERARDLIRAHLAGLGLTMKDKAGIQTAAQGFYFLRKRFVVLEHGKIIIRLHPKALAEERQTLRNLKRKVDDGTRTMHDVQVHYQSWIANAEYAGDAPIRKMDIFYRQTFGQRPKYKRKRRYLYGSQSNPAGEKPPAGTRKPPAEGRA